MCGLLVPVLTLRIGALVGFPTLALAAVYVPYNGRTFYKWFEVNRSYKRIVRNNATYRSAAAEAGIRFDGREVEVGPPPGIGRINWLAAPFGPDEIAVLLHADRRTVTAAIEIEGPGVGLRDSEDQEALVDRFGTLLKHVANGDGFVTRIQMLARTLPADPDAHELDKDAGLAVVMARELTDICARLAEADIRVRQPLGQGRLASLVHSMYDPDHPIDHIQAMTQRNAWPAELDAMEPTYLQAKTRESSTREPWCHSTAWVKEWPMTPVGVNFLAPLLVHTPDVIRTVAVCMDLEPTEVAIERMLTEKTNDEADASRAAKMNRTVDPRDIAAHGRLDQRGEDLASGAAGVNLVGYITVSSRSPEALAR
ncbi:SCO6880 family protein, partial [Streptomyces sp. MCAF7]